MHSRAPIHRTALTRYFVVDVYGHPMMDAPVKHRANAEDKARRLNRSDIPEWRARRPFQVVALVAQPPEDVVR